MSSVRTVALSGTIALLLAISLIAITSLGGVPLGAEAPSTTTTTTRSGQITSSTGQTQSTTSSTSGPAGQGVLSVLLTDPPRVSSNVSRVYVSYNDLEIRGEYGLVLLKAAGEVELLGTTNRALTISSARLPAGSYDSLELNIVSATVTFSGMNYSAVVQGGQLTVRIEGGGQVSNSQPAAAVLDLQPTVINIGSNATPEFVMRVVAMSFPFPGAEVNPRMENEGNTESLVGRQWWYNYLASSSASLQITSASLSANSISLNLKNTGTASARPRLVVVSEANPTLGMQSANSVPSEVYGSALFVVEPNGTLVQFLPSLHVMRPLAGENQSSFYQALLSAGYNLTPGSSASLSYSGSIMLSFGMPAPVHGILSGSQYWITVIGDEAVASVEVTAS